MKINAYAALGPKSALSPFTYEPGNLGAFDVEIAISHCGICFSDVHLLDDDWKRTTFPFVPGHEIVGTVTALGNAVKDLKKGQRVGVGWQRGACLECDFCLEGNDNLCLKQTAICVGHHGGFADRIRTDSRFAFALPESLPSAATAPLLCGGATVFAPISRFGVGPKSKVGVIGIGGLGHMALLFLKALGCEITAFSTSESKRAEALRMGAHDFVSSTNPKEIMKQAE
ncbi:MAG: NAD(P)-dependent alcohol dehydrogenase, partial [Bdellovibrionota bacterium]